MADAGIYPDSGVEKAPVRMALYAATALSGVFILSSLFGFLPLVWAIVLIALVLLLAAAFLVVTQLRTVDTALSSVTVGDNQADEALLTTKSLSGISGQEAPLSGASFHYLMDFIQDAPLGIALIGRDGEIREANRTFAEVVGLEAPVKRNLLDFLSAGDRKKILRQIAVVSMGQGSAEGLEVGIETDRTARGQIYLSRFGNEIENEIIVYLIDSTAQKELEIQFAQSQKMQAVGQLAGGVAHDFNNLLTAIIGFCDLLLQRHPAGDPSFADIMQIQQNANRAANLTRQLLAFSRKQTLQPKVLSVTEVLADISNLIRRLLGDRVELQINHQRGVGRIRADAGQIEQVIVNLAVNARDAMPNGGTLRIATDNVHIAEPQRIRQQTMPLGDYIVITVSDTGVGIPVGDLDKIFEPFYTTKVVGQGTGLGLSTVDGIISQSGGYLDVTSQSGVGTQFRIYLPQVAEAEVPIQNAGGEAATLVRDLTGKETILLVEDEDAVRMFAQRALSNKGYEVLTAEDGEAALELLADYDGPLSLIISDVMMPNMDGPTMMVEAIKSRPDVKVIFISGYADDAFKKGIDPSVRFDFLAKPFSLGALAEKVRDVLEKE